MVLARNETDACAPASGRSSPGFSPTCHSPKTRSRPITAPSIAATPLKVKGILLAALAYFVLPIDIVPDFILGLGFTDDLTVLVTAFSLIRTHMRPDHYDRAQQTIRRLRDQQTATV